MKASELKNLDVRDLIDELNSLDFENVGGWPLPVKIGAAILVFAAILLLGYFLAIKDLNARHGQLEREETSLLESYEKKAFQAHNLEQYRQQLVEMEASFETLKSQLPRDTEVPGLLEDITHTGLGSGLEFETIELKDEVKKEFYAELPIDIRVIMATSTAPESSKRFATVAVSSIIWFLNGADPQVVGYPLTEKRSFRPYGIPCKGPR